MISVLTAFSAIVLSVTGVGVNAVDVFASRDDAFTSAVNSDVISDDIVVSSEKVAVIVSVVVGVVVNSVVDGVVVISAGGVEAAISASDSVFSATDVGCLFL